MKYVLYIHMEEGGAFPFTARPRVQKVRDTFDKVLPTLFICVSSTNLIFAAFMYFREESIFIHRKSTDGSKELIRAFPGTSNLC